MSLFLVHWQSGQRTAHYAMSPETLSSFVLGGGQRSAVTPPALLLVAPPRHPTCLRRWGCFSVPAGHPKPNRKVWGKSPFPVSVRRRQTPISPEPAESHQFTPFVVFPPRRPADPAHVEGLGVLQKQRRCVFFFFAAPAVAQPQKWGLLGILNLKPDNVTV